MTGNPQGLQSLSQQAPRQSLPRHQVSKIIQSITGPSGTYECGRKSPSGYRKRPKSQPMSSVQCTVLSSWFPLCMTRSCTTHTRSAAAREGVLFRRTQYLKGSEAPQATLKRANEEKLKRNVVSEGTLSAQFVSSLSFEGRRLW